MKPVKELFYKEESGHVWIDLGQVGICINVPLYNALNYVCSCYISGPILWRTILARIRIEIENEKRKWQKLNYILGLRIISP